MTAHVYVMVEHDGVVKVGRSIQPAVRSVTLGKLPGGKLEVAYQTEEMPAAFAVERLAHQDLTARGYALGDERYSCSVNEAIGAVERAITEVTTRPRTQRPIIRPHNRLEYGKAMSTPIPVRFPEEMIKAIEAIQAERMDRPEKSAIIRELVAEAISARKRKAGR